MLWLSLALMAGGIALLWVSADPFVVAATRLAHIWKVSPVLVGALVVGFGTSAPEFAVSGVAALRGELAESVGNVVGSNSANLSLVLGISAFISPVARQKRLTLREGVLTCLAMGATVVVLWDDALSRLEGILLLVAMAVVIYLLITWSGQDIRRGTASQLPSDLAEGQVYRLDREMLRVGISLLGILTGSWMLVEGSDELAVMLGLTGGFVGATILAMGTSLPEIATTIAAARHKANALVLGNLLGSNLFNSLLVVGSVGILGPGVIGEPRIAEYMTMLAIGVLVIVLGTARRFLGRTEGVVLFVAFAIFIAVVSQDAIV